MAILGFLMVLCGCTKMQRGTTNNKVQVTPVVESIQQLESSKRAADLIDACKNLAAAGAEAKPAVPKLTELVVDLQDLPPEVSSAAAEALEIIDPEEGKIARAKAQSVANLRRIGHVLHLFDSSNGMLPTRRFDPFKPAVSWRAQLTELLTKRPAPEESEALVKKYGKARADVLSGPLEKTEMGIQSCSRALWVTPGRTRREYNAACANLQLLTIRALLDLGKYRTLLVRITPCWLSKQGTPYSGTKQKIWRATL
jgi:hypothetical protein